MNDTELDELMNLVIAPPPPPSLRRGLAASLPAPRRKIFGMPLRWVLASGSAALFGLAGAAAFNISPVQGEFWGAVESPDGTLYATTTRLVDPPIANLKWWFLGGAYSFGGTLQSMDGSGDMHNRFTKMYVGYRYELDRVADGQYRVTFSPPDAAEKQKQMAPFKLTDQLAAPPSLPDPTIVHMDEPFEVTLYASGGERIYDRIVVSRTAPQRTPFAKPDPTTVLSLAGAQVYVDGRLVLTKENAGSGPVIWVRLPGQGRFLAALDPQHNPLFAQAGHVNGNVLEFQSGTTEFRIVCSRPITTGGDRPLFVFHQQSFEDLLDLADPRSRQPMLSTAGPAAMHHQNIP